MKKELLTIMFCGILFSLLVNLNAQVDTSGLLGYFSFENVSGTEVPCDYGRGSDAVGALTGDAAIIDQGKYGKGLVLDGTGDYVDFDAENTNPFRMSGEKNMSVACWVMVANVEKDAHQNFVAIGDKQYSLKMNHKNNWQTFYYTDKWYGTGVLAEASQNGVWVHMASTHGDDDTTRLYLNGEYVSSKYAPGNLSTDPAKADFNLNFGRDSENGVADDHRFLEGQLDEIYIFNRTLSAEEITALMNLETIIPDKPDNIASAEYSSSQVNVYYESGIVRVKSNANQPSIVTLYNMVGQAVAQYHNSNNSWDINTSGLAKGIYIISIEGVYNKSVETQKIIVK